MKDIANLGIRVDSTDVNRAGDDLQKLTTKGKAAEKSTKNLATAAKQSNAGLRSMRNTVGQLGFQIQDIAVQLQSGQNALLVFGQQGSQIASIFGPGGAIAGAVIAIGAAIGGSFIPQLLQSENAVDDLEQSLDQLKDTISIARSGTVQLTDEFKLLAETSREVAEVQIRSRLITATNAAQSAFKVFRDEAEDMNVAQARMGNAVRGNANIMARAAKQYGLTSKELSELRELTNTAFSSESVDDVLALQERMNELALTSETVNRDYIELADSVNKAANEFAKQEKVIDQLTQISGDLSGTLEQEKFVLAGLAAEYAELEQQERLEARALAEVTRSARRRELDAERDLIRTLRDEERALQKVVSDFEVARLATLSSEERLTEAAEKRALAFKNAFDAGKIGEEEYGKLLDANSEKLDEQLKQIEDKAEDTKNSFQDIFAEGFEGTFADILKGDFEDGFSGILDSFANLLLEMTIQATAADLVGSLFPGEGSSTNNTSSLVGGLASIFSFDGGGHTGSAPRIGGLDGKGGFLAMVHPNETIVDHTKGQSAGNYNISMNFPGISNAREARAATGHASRQILTATRNAERFA